MSLVDESYQSNRQRRKTNVRKIKEDILMNNGNFIRWLNDDEFEVVDSKGRKVS